MFEALGLSQKDGRVYLAILEVPHATDSRISELVNMARDETRECIHRLEEHTLIARTSDVPPKFFPAPPGVALEAVALRRRQEIDLAVAQAGSLAKRLYREAITNPSDLIEMILGREALKQRAMEAIATARREVMCLSRPPYIQTDDEIKAHRPAPGTIQRYIYDQAALDSPGHLEVIERDVAIGEQARFVPNLPMKLIIVDGSSAYIAFDLSDPDVTAGIVVHPSSLLDALIILFELLWDRGIPLTFANAGGLEPLGTSSEDDRLLTLLATGLKDEAVARRLGISGRSLRRRIARLQAELGAMNRFQAGVQAVRLNRMPT